MFRNKTENKMLDRSKPPKIDDEIKLSLPQLNKFRLNNGFSGYYIEKKSLPIIKTTFVLKRGSIYDPEGKSGLANLTGMLLDEGANGHDALEIDSMLEMLGSVFNISVDHNFIILSLLSLTKNFEKSLEIVSWIIKKPNFHDEDFKREKNKLLSEIIRLKDEPSFIADWALGYYVMGNSPYRFPNIGTSLDVEKIALSDVKSFYENNFSPEDFSAISVGNLPSDEFANLITKYFSDWENKALPTPHVAVPQKDKRKIIFIDKQNAQQSEIRIGNLASERKESDYFPKKILNAILGGQFSSRLNHNLREEKGITYGVRTSFSHSLHHGLFEASTAVDTANTLTALNEFSKEFELIREDVTEEEISFAKSYMKKIFPSQFENYSKIASSITTQVIYNLPDDYFSKFIDNIDSVTKSEIIEAAKKNILPHNQVIVIVGDKNTLENDIRKFAGDDAELNFLTINDLSI